MRLWRWLRVLLIAIREEPIRQFGKRENYNRACCVMSIFSKELQGAIPKVCKTLDGIGENHLGNLP